MSETALQRLHQRLSRDKQESKVIVKILPISQVVWKKAVDSRPTPAEFVTNVKNRSFVGWKQSAKSEPLDISEFDNTSVLVAKPINFQSSNSPTIEQTIANPTKLPLVRKPVNFQVSKSSNIELIVPKNLKHEAVEHNKTNLLLKFASR